MTLTYAGFDDASGKAISTEGQWATYNYRLGKLQNSEGILTGGGLTAVAGSRRLSVSAFQGILPGLLVDNDAALQTPLHDAQASGTRIDYLTLTADWATNTVAFEVVKGASGTTPPSLGTQSIGALYRMPYARITVRAAATAFNVATDVEVCKPIARQANRYVSAVNSDTMSTNAADWNSLGFVDVIDPGWPYLLHIDSLVRFNATESAGSMRIRALDVTAANDLGHGITPNLQVNNAGRSAAVMNRTSGVLTGSRRIRLEMFPAEFGATVEQIQVLPFTGNHFTVTQIPA